MKLGVRVMCLHTVHIFNFFPQNLIYDHLRFPVAIKFPSYKMSKDIDLFLDEAKTMVEIEVIMITLPIFRVSSMNVALRETQFLR